MTLHLSFYEIIWGTAAAILLGAFFGIVYDIIRLIRILLGTRCCGVFISGFLTKKSKMIANKVQEFRINHVFFRVLLKYFDAVLDFFFFIFCAVCYSIFLYASNHGIFRFVFLFGCIGGFILYRKTLGRIVFYFLREIAAFLYLKFFFCFKIFAFFVFKPTKWIVFHVFLAFYRKMLLLFRKKHDIINNKERNL